MNKETHTSEHGQYSIQEKILENIRTEKIHMRPKFYFTLVFIALVLVSVFVFCITAFIFSYIVFSVRASSDLFLLGFGFRGFILFLLFFPWVYVILNIILICLLEWLVRRFSFGYKHSIVLVFAVITVVLLSVSLLVEYFDTQKKIHYGIEKVAHEQKMPLIRDMYTKLRRPPQHGRGLCRCVVVGIDGNTLTLVDDDPNIGTTTMVKILLPDNYSTSTLQVGDNVFVVGEVRDGQIHAFGIREMK